MSPSVLNVLQRKKVISADCEPMRPNQHGLEGAPIIDISRNPKDQSFDFMVYDNVTSPDGRRLIQNSGSQYAVLIENGDLQVVDKRNIEGPLAVGLIERYPSDYYPTDRKFVDGLEAMCR